MITFVTKYFVRMRTNEEMVLKMKQYFFGDWL